MQEKDKIFQFRPIGVIHTPFREKVDAPRQGYLEPEIEGTVEVYPEFEAGLRHIEGRSHIILIFCFHRSSDFDLLATPPHEDAKRGVFATRSPRRPNPIGMTPVRLVKRDRNVLHVAGVDMLDGTPLLDIKPYIAESENFRNTRKSRKKDMS